MKKFLVKHTDSMRKALQKIEKNNHGIVFVADKEKKIFGSATDGDIRRFLLNGGSLDDSITDCVNVDFVWETKDTSREALLKKLDNRIRVIPILDDNRHFLSFVSRDNLPAQSEENVFARARAPVRISFGGGGSDLTHYFSEINGAVVNATVSIYSHASLKIRTDSQIIISSRDIGETLVAPDLQTAYKSKGKLGLILALVKAVSPKFGFELYIHSDFPIGSGLGGSAAVSAAVLSCFNQFRRDQWDLYELAELSYQAERLHLGIEGGWQDQYATVFGGFNFMEFQMEQNIVHPLRLRSDVISELEECLILCNTGGLHDSGKIHKDQRKSMQDRDVQARIKKNVELSYKIRNNLLKGQLLEFGQSLHEGWQNKRLFSTKISNKNLDDIYDGAIGSGAIGGKLLGAGGGGFFLFFVPPFRKFDLLNYLTDLKLKSRSFLFDDKGVHSWTTRERKINKDLKSK